MKFYNKSTALLEWSDGWRLRAACDKGILDVYCWLCKRYGYPIIKNHLYGPHISVVKGETPLNKNKWAFMQGEITFFYEGTVKAGNGCHMWLDVMSGDLDKIRVELGLGMIHYHLTLGRIA